MQRIEVRFLKYQETNDTGRQYLIKGSGSLSSYLSKYQTKDLLSEEWISLVKENGVVYQFLELSYKAPVVAFLRELGSPSWLYLCSVHRTSAPGDQTIAFLAEGEKLEQKRRLGTGTLMKEFLSPRALHAQNAISYNSSVQGLDICQKDSERKAHSYTLQG